MRVPEGSTATPFDRHDTDQEAAELYYAPDLEVPVIEQVDWSAWAVASDDFISLLSRVVPFHLICNTNGRVGVRRNQTGKGDDSLLCEECFGLLLNTTTSANERNNASSSCGALSFYLAAHKACVYSVTMNVHARAQCDAHTSHCMWRTSHMHAA